MTSVSTPPLWLLAAAIVGAAGCADDPDAPAGCVARSTSAIYAGFAANGDAGPLADRARSIAAIEDPYGNTLCTGVIVHPRWVLTAAHCAASSGPLRVVGRAGASVAVPLMDAVTHSSVDLALLEVGTPEVLAREEIATIALRTAPLSGDVSVGAMLLLAGVGSTEDGGMGQLRFVEEPVTAMTETTITVDGQGKSGACEGDSGGPLVAWTEDGPEVVGILRAGSANCLGLDEYIRVDAYSSWITEHLLPIGSPRTCSE